MASEKEQNYKTVSRRLRKKKVREKNYARNRHADRSREVGARDPYSFSPLPRA